MLKLAFPTEDGTTLSAHFGRAPYFIVVTLDDPNEPKFEQRSKAYHGDEAHGPQDHHNHDHNGMFAPFSDCQVLIAGGMGQPAYQRAEAAGLKIILTGEKTIASALQLYRQGTLVSDLRRVHIH